MGRDVVYYYNGYLAQLWKRIKCAKLLFRQLVVH